MSWFRQFLAGNVMTSGQPQDGLFQKADGTVWLRNPDGSESQVGSGGSLSVSDGETTVSDVTSVVFTGATVSAGEGDGEADVDISGEGGSGTPMVRVFSFAYNTPDLTTGADAYTPAEGEIILDLWIEIDIAWNGTTPSGDVSPTFADTAAGLIATTLGQPVAMEYADGADFGDGAIYGNSLSDMLSASTLDAAQGAMEAAGGSSPYTLQGNGSRGGGTRLMPFKMTASQPIQVVVSQDGTAGGASPGSTQGAAKLYIISVVPLEL